MTFVPMCPYCDKVIASKPFTHQTLCPNRPKTTERYEAEMRALGLRDD